MRRLNAEEPVQEQPRDVASLLASLAQNEKHALNANRQQSILQSVHKADQRA
jgi:hypothetical protein